MCSRIFSVDSLSSFRSPSSKDLTTRKTHRNTLFALVTISVTNSSHSWTFSRKLRYKGFSAKVFYTYSRISLRVRSSMKSLGYLFSWNAVRNTFHGRLGRRILKFCEVSVISQSKWINSSWSPLYSSRPSTKKQNLAGIIDCWMRRLSAFRRSAIVHERCYGFPSAQYEDHCDGKHTGIKQGNWARTRKKRERRRPSWDFCISVPLL